MAYKGLIIKIQKLQANYNRRIADIQKQDNYYNPNCSKEAALKFYQDFADELDKVLISEYYGMKKHFKY